jgi:perosamine synthetase|tara:strand:- start:2847 stop:4115 length:1269 start_codon:yes stop_codon:yes gene_type:complete
MTQSILKKIRAMLLAARLGKYNFVADSLSMFSLFKIMVDLFRVRSYRRTDELQFKAENAEVIYTSSGRSALYLLLKSIYESKRPFESTPNIIIPGFSCVVVCNAAVAAGFEVRFADIQKSDFCLDSESVSKLVDSNTVALVVHHLFGFVDESIPEMKLRWPQIAIIEDCAHSLGSRFSDGSPIGGKGDFSFFSFEQSKPVTAWDGGALVVNTTKSINCDLLYENKNLIPTETNWNVLRTLFFLMFYTLCYSPKLYRIGIPVALLVKKVFAQENSMNSLELTGQFDLSKYWIMSPFKVKIIKSQLVGIRRRQGLRSKRAALMGEYLHQFKNIPVNSYVLRFPLLVNDRSDFLEHCKVNDFLPGLWFTSPLHPVLIGDSRFPYTCGSCPNAEFMSSRIVNLPVSEKYSDEDILRVVYLVTRIIQ